MTELRIHSQKVLRAMHHGFLWLHRRALRYPGRTVATILVAVLLGLPGLGRLKMLLMMDDLIDSDFSTYHELKDLNQTFKDKNNLLLIVRPQQDRVPTFDEICAVRSWVQRLSQERTDLKRIVSSFGPARVQSDDHHLGFQPLLDVNCGLAKMDPQVIARGLEALRASPWGASLTSLDAKDIVVMLYLQDSGDPRFGSFDGSAVGEIMHSFDQQVVRQNPGLRPHWSGVAVYLYYTKMGFDQANALNLLTFTIVFILFRIMFGTFKSSALFLLTYILTLLPMFAGMGFTDSPIDVLSNSLSLMMLIACVEDFLFVSFVRLRHPDKSWRYAFRVMLVPSFFTSLTTAIGFGSLVTARMGIVRRFGVWAAFAAVVEWIMVFYFLPALLQLWPRMRQWVSGERARSFAWLERVREWRLSPAVARASLMLFVVALAGAHTLRVSDAPENVFPLSHPLRQDASFIEKTRAWVTEVSLVFDDVDSRRFNDSILEKLAKDPLIKAIESPYAATDYLRTGLKPNRADLVSQLWTLSPFAEHLLDPDGISARAILFLNKTDIVDVNHLRALTNDLCDGHCHISGTLVSYGEFGTRVLQTFLSSMGMSLILVLFVVLFLGLALNVPKLPVLLLSLVWGPLVLLSIFVVLQVPLFYVTSIFASILIGMAGDNTIQFMFARRSNSIEGSVRSLGTASILLALTMCSLSCVLFLSYFTPLKILGGWMIFGISLTLCGELWVLKALAEKPILPRFAR
jgi:predicted RND superfamily exporter protein